MMLVKLVIMMIESLDDERDDSDEEADDWYDVGFMLAQKVFVSHHQVFFDSIRPHDSLMMTPLRYVYAMQRISAEY